MFVNNTGQADEVGFQNTVCSSNNALIPICLCSSDYVRRRDVFVSLLDKHLKGMVEYTAPDAGTFVWLRLLGVPDSNKLVMEKAITALVLMVPGQVFSPKNVAGSHMRMSFAIATDEQMDEALGRFAKLLKQEIEQVAESKQKAWAALAAAPSPWDTLLFRPSAAFAQMAVWDTTAPQQMALASPPAGEFSICAAAAAPGPTASSEEMPLAGTGTTLQPATASASATPRGPKCNASTRAAAAASSSSAGFGLRDSAILTHRHRTLMAQLCKDWRLTLLFSGMRDGFTGADFHRCCDNRGPTLIVMESKEPHQVVFGGTTAIGHMHPQPQFRVSHNCDGTVLVPLVRLCLRVVVQ
jgi:hypothetical protein